LYHVEPTVKLDDHALACRLSYFLWNSLPDELLRQLADSGKLQQPAVLKQQVERMLSSSKSQRFVDDFLGQWLKLRSIAANDADRKLYPEFNPYLQDSMVAETRGYFRELIERNLDSRHLIRSDFVMINQKLATHYGIPGVVGSQIRRVALPEGVDSQDHGKRHDHISRATRGICPGTTARPRARSSSSKYPGSGAGCPWGHYYPGTTF
jgi:Protein of unknown function (DUF1592)